MKNEFEPQRHGGHGVVVRFSRRLLAFLLCVLLGLPILLLNSFGFVVLLCWHLDCYKVEDRIDVINARIKRGLVRIAGTSSVPSVHSVVKMNTAEERRVG